MDEASGAPRSSLASPSAVPASRPSLQRSPLQQTWLQLTAAVAVAILLLLLAFVVWPVLRVLATSLAGPEGLTLAHYAEFFSSWRLVRILVQSLLVAVVSTVITVAVALSLARPGLASAALIVFILCMTDFGNPILIGGRYNVLATEIYAQVIGMSNFAAGATMSVVLIVPCLVAYLVNASWVGTRSYVTVSAGARAAARPMPPALRWPLFVLSGGVGLFIAVIYALIPLGSVVRHWGGDWSLSLDHYAFASSAEGAWPIWNSVRLAALAGTIGTVVALVTAYVVERTRPPGRRAIEALSLLPVALPGTVIGLGYILAFNVPPLLLTGTIWILVTSVVFWKFPVAVLAGIDRKSVV